MKTKTLLLPTLLACSFVFGIRAQENGNADVSEAGGSYPDASNAEGSLANSLQESPEGREITMADAEAATQTDPAEASASKAKEEPAATAKPNAEAAAKQAAAALRDNPQNYTDIPPECWAQIGGAFMSREIQTCFGYDPRNLVANLTAFSDAYTNPQSREGNRVENFVNAYVDQFCQMAPRCELKNLDMLITLLDNQPCRSNLGNSGWLTVLNTVTRLYPLMRDSLCTEGPVDVVRGGIPTGKCGAFTANKIIDIAKNIQMIPGIKTVFPIPADSNLMSAFINPFGIQVNESEIGALCDQCIPIYGRASEAYRQNRKLRPAEFANTKIFATTFLETSLLAPELEVNCPRVVRAFVIPGGALASLQTMGRSTILAISAVAAAALLFN